MSLSKRIFIRRAIAHIWVYMSLEYLVIANQHEISKIIIAGFQNMVKLKLYP